MLGLGLGLQYPRGLIGGGAPFSGIFNQFTGGSFGASLRLLDENYTGGLVRVIAYDGVTEFGRADIMPFQIGSQWWVDMNSLLANLDATALGRGLGITNTLADLVSAGVDNYHGLVPNIYDQTGGGNGYTQNLISRQGQLVNAGVLNTENGKPIIKKINSNSQYLSNYPINDNLVKQMNYVGKQNSLLNKFCLYSCTLGTNSYIYFGDKDSINTTSITNANVVNSYLNSIAFSPLNRGDVWSGFINQFINTIDVDTFTFESNNISLGYRFGTTSFDFDFVDFQENIFWTDRTNKEGKETNINNAFNIF